MCQRKLRQSGRSNSESKHSELENDDISSNNKNTNIKNLLSGFSQKTVTIAKKAAKKTSAGFSLAYAKVLPVVKKLSLKGVSVSKEVSAKVFAFAKKWSFKGASASKVAFVKGFVFSKRWALKGFFAAKKQSAKVWAVLKSVGLKVLAVLWEKFLALAYKVEEKLPKGVVKQLTMKNVAASLCAVAFVFSIFNVTFGHNAHEVVVNGESVAVVRLDRNITEDVIVETVAAQLEEIRGVTEVVIDAEVELVPIRASWDEIEEPEVVVAAVMDAVNYSVAAANISVNGVVISSLTTREEAETVLEKIIERHISEDAIIEEADFLEDVIIEDYDIFVDAIDIVTIYEAVELLIASTEVERVYEIVSGDSLSLIAVKNDVTVEQIIAANPGITENSLLRIGQLLQLTVPQPLVTVRTVETATFYEVLVRPVEYIENTSETRAHRIVREYGEDGEAHVTASIVRHNGFEYYRTVINKETIVEPIAKVVEVGTQPIPPRHATGSFIRPIRGGRFSSGFGMRGRSMHNGVDWSAPRGTPIYAADGGVVRLSGNTGNGYGIHIIIDHGNGFQTLYAHNSQNLVTVGQRVAQGEMIARVGSTGNSTGNHLHFEIIQNGRPVNPMNFIR